LKEIQHAQFGIGLVLTDADAHKLDIDIHWNIDTSELEFEKEIGKG
jgi:hypothetical protein